MSRPKNSKTNVVLCYDDKPCKPCSNAKFMHIAGLPGMVTRTSYDSHYHEETTCVYLDDVLMAERIMQCVHFPGERPEVNCFIVGYYKGIVNEQV
ncbi:hypothetical protein GuL6_011 [Buttiauxella phage vB_ButM_GuL6]|nr:hypothetical protein GuL6_011 [Buttiauxella phage vB_ButM_GuL6]